MMDSLGIVTYLNNKFCRTTSCRLCFKHGLRTSEIQTVFLKVNNVRGSRISCMASDKTRFDWIRLAWSFITGIYKSVNLLIHCLLNNILTTVFINLSY